MSNRNIDADDLINIIKSLDKNNNCFKTIKLGSNRLKDNGAKIIATILSNNICIENLDLGFNDITDEGILVISEALMKNTYLKVLYLSGNRISIHGFKCLSDALIINNGINALHLSANFCYDEGCQYLANALKENMKITTVCLNGNYINSTGAYHLSQTLLSNNTITYLNLSDNNIGDEGLSYLSVALQCQKKILVLELSFNNITEVGVSALCCSLSEGHPCHKLMLDNNKLKGNGACFIANILGKSSLKTLSVAFNEISTKGITSIVNQMMLLSDETNLQKSIVHIEWLDLRGNSINHEAASLIATMLSKNFTLTSLFLDKKSLSETSIIELTVGIASNYTPTLTTFEGFPLGSSLVKTLRFPSSLTNLSNDAVLKFLKEGWSNGDTHNLLVAYESNRLENSSDIDMLSVNLNSSCNQFVPKAALSLEEDEFQIVGSYTNAKENKKPMENIDDRESQWSCSPSFEIICNNAELTKRVLSNTLAKTNPDPELDVWIKALREIILLPYCANKLWELHQYYYSPPTCTSQTDLKRENNLMTDIYQDHQNSFESTSSDDEMNDSHNHKRRVVQMLGFSAVSAKKKHSKRPNATLTRIEYYPKLKEQLVVYKSESNDKKTLTLLRQLRLLEEEYDVEQQEVTIENIIMNLC